MNMVAKVIYIIDPSRLKEYPSGRTKLTILFGQPKRSSDSIVLGMADSELAVLNANKIGSCKMRNSFKNGTRIAIQIPINTTKTKTISPP